ncbi:guanine-9--methyltransferase domain-containing protein 2-like protein [Basidiobolus meristosporus CBS 931.73]|uniref:tRNA (guanine(9)-N1)-methyltransferase n=1 Tax=Basidiobolus meristosporus CBS 931.73 TaxID=1314790 RepID=A0A1Y1Z5W1_9FUNG|nr:guanine-9--methyltransferase domain-containing protein 2-like protein [Basidiobolus meristosporus CBS 931.73]|eukprot:ORY05653.1 guanine-9--methyltransferase domain-containing protein 2-like protein [Basidiobolus meristosporus CBS 931.73]
MSTVKDIEGISSDTPDVSSKENQNKTRPSLLEQAEELGISSEGVTKNALRKLIKQKRLEITKEDWKVKKKLLAKQKKAEKRQAIEAGLVEAPPKKVKLEQEPSDVRVVLDLSFESLMTTKEISSMFGQIQRCYSANRACKHPVNIYSTSLGGELERRFNEAPDMKNWKNFTFEKRNYTEVFKKEELVYLTADSPNVIHELDDDKVYIIGGIVDKNRHKLLTYNKAQEEGIQTAQLPIGEFVKLATRKVLTVNHVFEILVKYLETKSWETAFTYVIPRRKFAELDEETKDNQSEQAVTVDQGSTPST